MLLLFILSVLFVCLFACLFLFFLFFCARSLSLSLSLGGCACVCEGGESVTVFFSVKAQTCLQLGVQC